MTVKVTRRGFLGTLSALALAGAASKLIRTNEGNRKINIIFNFGQHADAHDLIDFEALVKEHKPDVVCYEDTNVTEEQTRKLEDAHAQGRIPTHDELSTFTRMPFFKKKLEILRKYKVPRIYSLERFKENEFDEEAYRHWRNKLDGAKKAYLEGNYDIALSHVKTFFAGDAAANKQREEAINDQIEELHANLTKRYPELKNKKELTVLVRFGAAHTPLYINASRRGNFASTTRVMPNVVYPLYAAEVRRKTLSPHAKIKPRDKIEEDTAQMQALLSTLIIDSNPRAGIYTPKLIAKVNQICQKITPQQFESISSTTAEISKKGIKPQAAFELALKQHGIEIPTTVKEKELPKTR